MLFMTFLLYLVWGFSFFNCNVISSLLWWCVYWRKGGTSCHSH